MTPECTQNWISADTARSSSRGARSAIHLYHLPLFPLFFTTGGRAMSQRRQDDRTSGVSSISSGNSSGAILLVDATPSAPTLATVLRHDGYTVRRVASPAEAQDALKRAQFDLTLVDMPEESAAARALLARL